MFQIFQYVSIWKDMFFFHVFFLVLQKHPGKQRPKNLFSITYSKLNRNIIFQTKRDIKTFEPRKRPRPYCHYTGWFHTDPFHGLLKSLYSRVVYSPITYPKQPGSRFSLLFSFPTSSPKDSRGSGGVFWKRTFSRMPPRLPRKKPCCWWFTNPIPNHLGCIKPCK